MPTRKQIEKNVIEIITSNYRPNWEKDRPGITKPELLRQLNRRGIKISTEQLNKFLVQEKQVVGVRRNGQVFVGGLSAIDFGDFLELIERVLKRHESPFSW